MTNYLLHIIRPFNLALIAISQAIIYYTFVIPLFEKYEIKAELNGHLIWLFLLDTVLIAAGGYVINDLKDISTDTINKPEKSFIGEGKLSLAFAKYFYTTLTILGAAIAIYIALEIDKPLLFIIYPVAVGLLYMYSHSWKKRPLSGNMVVAIFCAFVPGIIWYAESAGMHQLHHKEPFVVALFGAYIVFGFLATLAREIIKDIEDIDGDKAAGYQTFPITAGVSRAKFLATTTLLLLLFSYSLWIWSLWQLKAMIGLVLTILLLILPTVYLAYKSTKASKKEDYSLLSKKVKYLLLISLIIFVTAVKMF